MEKTLIKNTVKVRRIIYHNPSNNWGVFTYINDDTIPELEDPEVKVSGNFSNLFEDSEVEISGEVIFHPTYGPQISLSSFKLLNTSNTKNGIIEFLTISSISGIAHNNAVKIFEKFGKDSINVVLNKTEEIKSIDGIGDKTYEKVVKSVAKYRKREELLNFCNELGGIPYSVTDELFNTFGKDAVVKIKKDPYELLENSSLTFKQIDNIASKLGIAPDNDSRLKYGLIYVLKNESSLKGSTGCNFQELRKAFLRELGISDLNTYQYALDILVKENKVVIEFNQVFLTEFYEAERNIADYLALCRTTQISKEYSEEIIEEELNNFSFKLNKQQINAIHSCLKNMFSIITSLAGGGKSTITKAIVNILNRHGENIILLSPTGKAAKRLSECTDFPAQTIHRFLQVKDNVSDVVPETVSFNTTIIIDEASMVDVLLLEKVIACTRGDTRIILVGDTHQLPSIQAGNILEDIISSNLFNVCTLTDIMRQAENSNIIKYCAKVNDNESFSPVQTKDFVFLNFNSRDKALDALLKLYKKSVEAFGLQETQVLCAYKLGTLGMKHLNEELKAVVNKKDTNVKFPFSLGDKVKHTRNNYKKNVFNGETGIVADIQLAEDFVSDTDEDTLYVDYGDRLIPYTKSDVHELQLSYASTVHASQGSEYKSVFVVLDNEISNILLIRKIIYTALSRAKLKCILISTGNCVSTAIHNNFYKERITKLKNFILGDNNEFNFN